MNRKLLLRALLQEEEDDDMLLLAYFESRKRRKAHAMYQKRRTEGYSRILIRNHLVDNDETYRQFFCLNKEQIHFVLNLVGKDLEKNSYSRVKNPISLEDKLLLTLRQVNFSQAYFIYRHLDLAGCETEVVSDPYRLKPHGDQPPYDSV